MSTAPDWLHSLPALERLDAEALDLLSKAATRVELKSGTVLFRPGDACASFLIVLAGSVRVQLLSEAGREIVLYRVGPGSTCVLTTSCLIGSEGYGAEGITESAVSAVALPKDSFDRLITQSTAFRDFVFHSFEPALKDYFRLVSAISASQGVRASSGLRRFERRPGRFQSTPRSPLRAAADARARRGYVQRSIASGAPRSP